MKHSTDAPRNITIRSTSDIDNLKEDPGNIEISCNADCKPECDRYLIYYDGLILNTSKDTIITKSRRNSGRYQCAASNAISNSYLNSTNSVDIDIKYVPSNVRIQYWSDYGGLREGPGYIYINCSADCNPECDKYLIYHNGNVISQSEEIKITKNHSYSGRYHCAASNSLIQRYEYSTDDVFIDIQYAPRNVSIKYSSDNGDMLEGNGYINFTCNADCNPECDLYLIYYNGDSVSQEYRRKETRIKKDRINSGLYRCKAINSFSNSFSDAVNISIHYGPITASVLRKNQIISLDIIEKEDNYTTIPLKCSSSCYPLCKIAWYKDEQLQHIDSPVIEITRDRRVSGVYHCEASGVEGNVKSNQVHVIIQYPPGSVTITPNNDTFYTKIHGKPLHDITCEADCLPKCTYMWFRHDNNHPYTTGNSLFAKESYDFLQPSKTFLCRASNKHKYRDNEPNISSDVDQTTITAPDLLDLSFSVDSSPSSNVTIFHETKTLTFLPHVTGQLSYNVSIESCLDQGKYRVEAVNDAGSDRFTLIAKVICSPVIVRYSNLSQKGYQVGDSLSYKVDFMANPEAKVSWTFIDWNNKEPKELEKTLIQNQKESTMVFINRLNFSPPHSPIDLNVDCPRSAIISWRPGFDGGATQNFVIEYSDNSSYWLTHHPQSVVSVDNNFMSAQIHDIRPNTPYSFRIRAKNSFGVAASDTTVNCTWKNNEDEMASFLNNRNALVGIGVLVLLLLIVFAALVVLIKLKRRRESNNQDNASEIVENILYITADDAKEQVQAPVDTPVDTTQNGSDVYAVVEKKPKTDDRDDQPVYRDVCKADQKKKKPAIAAKPSKVKKDERPTVNKDGLIYVDLDLKDVNGSIRHPWSRRQDSVRTLSLANPPGDVTITPGNDTFYTKQGGKPLHDITCEADCVPECTYTWYREGYRYWYTAGNSLFATRSYYYSDKPVITSTKNQTTITAPDLLDLTFSVDGSPSSNVTIFHETKTLTFLPHVTGQLSFNVSIESCLDQGEYRVEAVNDVGFGSFNFMPNIKCPIVAATKTDPGTTISSRDSDSDEDRSMSPTSWKGKTNALRETEMNTFLLQQDKLHEEVQKLRLEGDVLRLKRNYYSLNYKF
uniref:Uncharacterized protein n=1 Tax=Magallana gigas TaxID=29159 RepID=A0A8W8KXQ9_MAGGI